MRKIDRPLKERFEDYVVKIPMTDCHLWTGYLNVEGYGKIGLKKKLLLAHRVSYSLYKGEIPPGMHVLHNCDVTWCVNPDHLRLGTHAENMHDKALRGKYKITNDKVREIRTDLKMGRKRACEIAKETGLTDNYIYLIKSRKTRKYL